MTLTGIVIRNIIRKLLTGQDYRSEIVTLLDAEFLQYVVDFFKRVACAKLDNKDITVDWYKKEFLSPDLFSPQEVAIHSGLNKKTITNMYNSGRKQIVLDASVEHYDALYDTINSLTGDLQVALDKILPAVIQSDEVQDSVTPAAALRERQQEEDSSLQLLVELE